MLYYTIGIQDSIGVTYAVFPFGDNRPLIIHTHLPSVFKEDGNTPITHGHVVSNWLDAIHPTHHHVDIELVVVLGNEP